MIFSRDSTLTAGTNITQGLFSDATGIEIVSIIKKTAGIKRQQVPAFGCHSDFCIQKKEKTGR